MNDSLHVMKVSNSRRDLHNNVTREFFRKVRKFNDLMEKFSSSHESKKKKIEKDQYEYFEILTSVSNHVLSEGQGKVERTHSRVR